MVSGFEIRFRDSDSDSFFGASIVTTLRNCLVCNSPSSATPVLYQGNFVNGYKKQSLL